MDRMRACVAAWVLVSLGCGEGETQLPTVDGGAADASLDAGAADAAPMDAEPDLSDEVFDPNHLLQVSIVLDEAEWTVLRGEGRSLPDFFAGCGDAGFEYSTFEATVTVDGERYERVGVRKKGFLGSLSSRKPSLKLDFAEYPEFDGRKHKSMRRMTLNNDRQDPSHTHQCMAYEVFRNAGLIAPRCSFAEVTVNGVNLGIFSHIESVKKPFLRRNFDDEEGNLYEGNYNSDFVSNHLQFFEQKTNERSSPGRQDLEAVRAAFDVGETDVLGALNQVINVDQFQTFWAVESLIGHWDGYNGNRNNYLIYADPTDDGRFSFIPWGTDGAFTQGNFPENAPKSVMAQSTLSNWLYNNPLTYSSYRGHLQEVLDGAWDEPNMLAEVDRIGQLTGAPEAALQRQRDFISGRRTDVQAELDTPMVQWPFVLQDDVPMCRPPTPIQVTFSTTFNENQFDFAASPSSLIVLGTAGSTTSFSSLLLSAGRERPGVVHLNILQQRIFPPNRLLIIELPDFSVTPGQHRFQGFESFGIFLEQEQGADWEVVGYLGGGTISFDAAGTNVGDAIAGSVSAELAR